MNIYFVSYKTILYRVVPGLDIEPIIYKLSLGARALSIIITETSSVFLSRRER